MIKRFARLSSLSLFSVHLLSLISLCLRLLLLHNGLLSSYLPCCISIDYICCRSQPGTLTAEVHPTLTSQQCTTAGGCVAVNTSIVLDAQYRYMHNVGGYANCVVNGAFNTTFCPDVATCAKECTLEGVDYSTYGIKTDGDALTLNLFTVANNLTKESSARVYLLANDSTYDILRLLNQEFTFDVDVSQVSCASMVLYISLR
jgi:cellulose 1,4-beta-cellobiosidase